jgi:hypothetical protein
VYVCTYVRMSACMYKDNHYTTHTHTHYMIHRIVFSERQHKCCSILSNTTSPLPTCHIFCHTHTRARTHARTSTGWFPQVTMAASEMLWLPGSTRISSIVTSPCINVTHARISVHITHQLTPFQPLNTTVYSHIITLLSTALCVTTLCHHHIDACFPVHKLFTL